MARRNKILIDEDILKDLTILNSENSCDDHVFVDTVYDSNTDVPYSPSYTSCESKFAGCLKNTVKKTILYKKDTKNSLCKYILHNVRWNVTNEKNTIYSKCSLLDLMTALSLQGKSSTVAQKIFWSISAHAFINRFFKTFTDVTGVAQASFYKTDHTQKSKTFKSGELGGHFCLVRNLEQWSLHHC